MRPRLILAALALCALAVPCLGQITKTQKGFLLRMQLKEGANYIYDMVSTTEMAPGQSFPINMSYVMKIGKIDKGVADVTMVVNSTFSKEPQTINAKMDNRGTVGPVAGLSGGLSGPSGVRLPEKALNIGDSWTEDQTLGDGAQAMKMKTVYTFKGMEIVNKVPCAVLDVKTDVTGQVTVSGTGKTYIEVSNGMLYKSDVSTKTTIPAATTGGKAQTVTSTVSIKRK